MAPADEALPESVQRISSCLGWSCTAAWTMSFYVSPVARGCVGSCAVHSRQHVRIASGMSIVTQLSVLAVAKLPGHGYLQHCAAYTSHHQLGFAAAVLAHYIQGVMLDYKEGLCIGPSDRTPRQSK